MSYSVEPKKTSAGYSTEDWINFTYKSALVGVSGLGLEAISDYVLPRVCYDTPIVAYASPIAKSFKTIGYVTAFLGIINLEKIKPRKKIEVQSSCNQLESKVYTKKSVTSSTTSMIYLLSRCITLSVGGLSMGAAVNYSLPLVGFNATATKIVSFIPGLIGTFGLLVIPLGAYFLKNMERVKAEERPAESA